MKYSKSLITFFLFTGVVIFYFGTTFLQSCSNNPKQISTGKKIADSDNAYVGPEKCSGCHAKEYALWKQSDHFHSMELPDDSTVKGNFNDAIFKADGVTSKMFKHDGKYFINTEGDDGKNHEYEVKYTFGYYPLQQYLVEFAGGRMQVPRLSWNVKEKKWFHQYAGRKIDHSDWLHWSHDSQNWNTMCAACHSTNLQKNYNDQTDSYNTTFSHINVSCEGCHGAGKNHITYISSDDYQKGNRVKDSYIALHVSDTNTVQLQSCVLCHSRKMEISGQHFSGDVLDNYVPQIPDTEYYYADGQIKQEDYEYGSFTQSKMFHRGVKCSSCHDPHSYKIKFDDNRLCTQCHAPKYDSPEHHFHLANSEGALCKNCHMPTHTYMGIDIRRDHSIRVPRPDLSVQYNVPNACNNCHKEKSNQWAADAVIKWYGATRKQNYVDDLLPASKLNEQSLNHIIKLLNDDSVPPIIKATAAYYNGLTGDVNQTEPLLKSINDQNSLVRYHAIQAISRYDSKIWIAPVCEKLSDPVRAVRIAAADALIDIPQQNIDAKYLNALSSARNEMITNLQYQTDFSVGSIMIADYYFRTKNYPQAEQYYLKAIKKDSLANYARLNLASVYDSQNNPGKALGILNEAAKVDPANGRVFYNLALIYHELNNVPDALKNFSKAYSLKYDDDGLYYNYGLLLQKTGDSKKAENIFQNGLLLFPNSAQVNYAMAFHYLQSNQKDRAKPFAIKCKSLDPGNPDYDQLLKQLR